MFPPSAPTSPLASGRTGQLTLTLLDSKADMSCMVKPLRKFSSDKNLASLLSRPSALQSTFFRLSLNGPDLLGQDSTIADQENNKDNTGERDSNSHGVKEMLVPQNFNDRESEDK